MPGPSLNGFPGGSSTGGGAQTTSSSFSTNIKALPQVAQINPGDFLILEIPAGTHKLDFADFIIGKENITFADELTALGATNNALLTLTDKITGSIFGVSDTLVAVKNLSALNPLTAVSGIRIGGIGRIQNNNGYYTFDVPVSSTINFFTSAGSSLDWNSTYNTFSVNSGDFLSTYITMTANSGNWESTYTTVYNNSASWGSGGGSSSDLSELAGASADWNSNYTTTNQNSASWGNQAALTEIAAVSSQWNSTYTDLNANSGQYESVFTSFNSISSNSSSVYTITNSNSSNWESTYTTVYSNSSSWGGGSGGSGHTIQYRGEDLASRTNLNFLTAGGVTDPLAADNSAADSTDITTPNGFDIMMISEVFR